MTARSSLLDHDSMDCRRVQRLGFHVALAPAGDMPIGGGVVSRWQAMVVSESGRMVASFRCTREGDFCGSGRVHDLAGNLTEIGKLDDLLDALQAHPLATPGSSWRVKRGARTR